MEQEPDTIGVIGAGTMGMSIARLAASNEHPVLLYDSYPEQLGNAKHTMRKNLQQTVETGALGQQEVNQLMQRIRFSEDLTGFDE